MVESSAVSSKGHQKFLTDLKLGDEQAWSILKEQYQPQIEQAIGTELRKSNVPIEFVNDLGLTCWEMAQDKIGNLSFDNLNHLARDLLLIAQECTRSFIRTGKLSVRPRTVEAQAMLMVGRLKQKDEAAWKELVNQYRPKVERTIKLELYKYQLTMELARDIEGTTWKTLYSSIHTLTWQGSDKFAHWIFSVARNCARTVIKKETVPTNAGLSIEDIIDDDDHAAETPSLASNFEYQNHLFSESAEVEILRQEVRDEVFRILEKATRELSARDRMVVMLYLFDKEKPRDLAKRFDISIALVQAILRRVKKIVRNHLIARGFFGNAG